MIGYLLGKHFITLGLTIGFMLKLRTQKSAGDAQLKYFWLTVISTLVLVAAESLEYWAQQSADRVFWRTLFAVIGYSFRPIAALSITLVVYPGFHRPRFIWIPALVNVLIYLTAFFSPIAFHIDENNVIQRGPLGFSVLIVSFFYIVCILWLKHKRFHSGAKEGTVLYLCAVLCIAAAVIDYYQESSHINATVMMSSIFLYIFLRSFDMNRDPMTKLRNRLCFYEDYEQYDGSVSAVVMLDINGLKKLNEDYGHDAGDRAIKAISDSLRQVSDKQIQAYRIGADEFALLFIRKDEQAVKDTTELLHEIAREKGYSISAGYVMREDRDEPVQHLIRRANQAMSKEKAEYYRQHGRNRRQERE